jgi:hypothetical protein
MTWLVFCSAEQGQRGFLIVEAMKAPRPSGLNEEREGVWSWRHGYFAVYPFSRRSSADTE